MARIRRVRWPGGGDRRGGSGFATPAAVANDRKNEGPAGRGGAPATTDFQATVCLGPTQAEPSL